MAVLARRLEVERLADVHILIVPRIGISEAVAERAITTPPGGPAALLAEIPSAERSAIAAGTVEDWSREYWAKARDLAYKTINPDACGPPPTTRPVLTEAHIQALTPAVRRNVAEGGIRLARLLDDALGPQRIAPPLKR